MIMIHFNQFIVLVIVMITCVLVLSCLLLLYDSVLIVLNDVTALSCLGEPLLLLLFFRYTAPFVLPDEGLWPQIYFSIQDKSSSAINISLFQFLHYPKVKMVLYYRLLN